MKTARKLLAFAIVLTLVLSFGSAAFASDAQFETTRDFVDHLESVDGFSIEIDDLWTEASGMRYEPVYISYAGGAFSDYESFLMMAFAEDGSEVEMYLYNLIYFDEKDLGDVLLALNELNAGGIGVKLFADRSDNTVTAELYLLTTEESSTDIAAMGLGYMLSYTDMAYEALESFNIR